jgi:2-methylcitrate dehydratase PrpD
MSPVSAPAAADAPTLAERLARFALSFDTGRLSPARRAKLPLILADFLGCALAGSILPEARTAFVLAQPGDVEVPGDGRRLSAETAAIALGTLGSLLQLHDGYGNGGNHPSGCIIAAVWSMRGGRSIEQVRTAIAVGYEIANRLAASAHPALTLAGVAPTSPTGAIGAAAALCRLLGLDEACTARAIANAAFSFPIAALRGLTEHGSVVPLHAGLAARCAIDAVRTARAGLSAGRRVLEGGDDPGVLSLLHAQISRLHPEAWLGETLDGVYFKPIPACRHAQPPIDALEVIWRQAPFSAADVVGIEVETYPLALRFCKSPDEHLELYDRLMSVPWAVASGLRHGRYDVENILAPVQDQELLRLCGLVRVRATATYEGLYPRFLGARVSLRLRDGTSREGESSLEYGTPSEAGPYSPPGTHRPPLDPDGVRQKFEQLATKRLTKEEANVLWASLHGSGDATDSLS